MNIGRRIGRSRIVRAALCWLIAQYVRVVWYTGRWNVLGLEHPSPYWRDGRPFIGVFWHGRLLMMTCAWQSRRRMNVLISHHHDGELIAGAMAHLGFATVRGSSRRGGADAMRRILRCLRAGEYVAVTPDGPRGPACHVTEGTINLARLAGVPIVPAAYSTTRGRTLASWDRFLIALPFSRGLFLWGAPIEVPRDADAATLEETRRLVETRLNALTDEADRLCGRAGSRVGYARP